ncbi:MAG: cytochrome c [Candidatus Sulfotelmatobacter sp.]|jgi:mono/diheme cytochrome c family protein
MPFEKKFANMALDAHIEKQHIPPSSVPADEPNFIAGASVYKQHCALCHGLPGQPPIDYATTMFPRPPQLFRGKGVTDDPVSEIYWKAANGIRFSGMPSFKTKLSDPQLWQVSQLLAHAN